MDTVPTGFHTGQDSWTQSPASSCREILINQALPGDLGQLPGKSILFQMAHICAQCSLGDNYQRKGDEPLKQGKHSPGERP